MHFVKARVVTLLRLKGLHPSLDLEMSIMTSTFTNHKAMIERYFTWSFLLDENYMLNIWRLLLNIWQTLWRPAIIGVDTQGVPHEAVIAGPSQYFWLTLLLSRPILLRLPDTPRLRSQWPSLSLTIPPVSNYQRDSLPGNSSNQAPPDHSCVESK